MGQAKAWQVGLVVLALLVLGGSVFWSITRDNSPPQVGSIQAVDVVTGERFVIDVRGQRAAIWPERHPDTGDRTLLPLYEENGQWKVSHIREVAHLPRDRLSAVVDIREGTVEPQSNSPRRIRRN